ncbi:MAG: hypothetical protein QM817_06175 [Archangium sp.]
MRLIPPVVCWLIVPINAALYWQFLASASRGTIAWSLFSVFIGLCGVQIVAGIVTFVTSPRKEGSEPAPALARALVGAAGTALGFLALLIGGGLPLVVRL